MQLLSSAVGLWDSGRVHSYVTVAPGATASSLFSSGPVPSGYKAPTGTHVQTEPCTYPLVGTQLYGSGTSLVSSFLTFMSFAVVESMRVDVVRSGS